MKKTNRGRTKGKTPKAVTLTDGMEAVVVESKRQETLEELIAEQKADYECSPFDDMPLAHHQQPKQYKRV